MIAARYLGVGIACLALLSGCGASSKKDSPDHSQATRAAANDKNDCPKDTVRNGLTIRAECGPALARVTRGKATVKLQGRCAVGPEWFELVAGKTVIDGGAKAPSARSLPDRVVLTVGRRTRVAGNSLRPAPRDGTYSPVALVGSIGGHSFNAFKSAVAVLQGGRTEGRVDAVEADGTKVELTFTCRKLPSA